MEFFLFLHETINKPFLIFLNSFTENKIISDIVYIFADAPIFILPLFLIWYWIYFTFKKEPENKNKLLFIFYSSVLAILISVIIQQFVQIERPETAINASKMILNHIPDASFPSDHASVWISFITSLFLFWFYRFWAFALPLFLVMLLSRIAGWVHWPLDILAWSIIWLISAFIVYKSRNLNILKMLNNFVLKIANFLKL